MSKPARKPTVTYTIAQPIDLLARAERRELPDEPPGPYLVVELEVTRKADARWKALGTFDHLAEAVDRVVEAGSAITGCQALLAGTLEVIREEGDIEGDGEEDDVPVDDLPEDVLKAKLDELLPDLRALKSPKYTAFALFDTLGYEQTPGSDAYLGRLATAYPAHRMVMGWSARAPLHDVAVAILRPS